MERINHLAVLVAAVVMFLFGWLWYVVLFAKLWTSYVPVTGAVPSPTILIGQFVLGWILAYFAAMAISKAPNPNMAAQDGIFFGLFTGIGFLAVPLLLDYISEGRPIGLWAVNAGYIVISMIIIGAIVTSWKKRSVVQASP